MLETVLKRKRRHAKIRSRISGTAEKPRLSVYRSNTSIYAQLVDDVAGKTLASASDIKVTSGTKTERAKQVGAEIATKAATLGIKSCVFDRGGFLYTGRVQCLADAAREGGLQF